MTKEFVKIVEVGPRDGLQNEKKVLPTKFKIELIQKLEKAGLKNIEVGAFVSPKWVPQMKDTNLVAQKILRNAHVAMNFGVLVPNEIGFDLAMTSGFRSMAIFGACTEAFSKRNINCSIDESFNRFKAVMARAKKEKVSVRGYLSTVFGCPYEGKVSPEKAAAVILRMHELGVDEISVGDTIGVATPAQVRALLKLILGPIPTDRVAMHFHDTRGTALANVSKSLEMGIRTFDSSVGGLGGCPYAKGATGNLATEDLLYLLHEMGYATEVNLKAVIGVCHWLQKKLKRELPSKVSRAGLPIA